MKKHRAQSDTALLEMLRSRGAVIGPTAGEALQAAVAKLDCRAADHGGRRDAETLPRGAVPDAAPRSSIRRFRSQTENALPRTSTAWLPPARSSVGATRPSACSLPTTASRP